jgi:hypothetical protein
MAADSNRIAVHWSGHDAEHWDTAHAAAGGALQQDRAYGDAMLSLLVPVLRARIDIDGEPAALAQLLVRRWGRIGAVALCSRGPVWLRDVTPHDKARAYRALKRSLPLPGLRFLLVTPEEEAGAPHGLSQLRRVMTGLSTVTLDLTQDLDALRAGFDVRWRNRLSTGERSGLDVQRVGTNPNQFRWLVEADMTQRAEKGLSGLPAPLFERYALTRTPAAKGLLTLRADAGRDRIAAMMFLIHGSVATYEIGWTTDKGRDLHAHNLILWNAMQMLKSQGLRMLDLGGVNTLRSAGLARFKLGTGGRVLTLAGTYLV